MRLVIATVYVCLLAWCAPVAAVEPAMDTQTDNEAAGDATHEPEKADQREDILDRAFAPLDDAVSDINRDLNEGDAGTSPEAGE